MTRLTRCAALASLLLAAGAAHAATDQTQAAAPAAPAAAAPDQTPAAAPSAPDKLTVLFAVGSAAVGADGDATLDKAARLYRAGNPIVMIVSGSADATGEPVTNLNLSERRAHSVLMGLVQRGIPLRRLQLLAAGTTEPAVKAADGVPEQQNRRVDITWR